jgi:hypothetical protein
MKVELVGQRFGRLVVLQHAECVKYRDYWHCGCACGNVKVVRGQHLKSKNHGIRSCGCLMRRTTHGQAGLGKRTKTYRCWQNMLDRCYNPNKTGYKYYGGRGITVCRRWRESFENFYADMGDKPPGMTLERIDNNRGYSPDNCKWATRSEQNQNRRNAALITYKGRTHNIVLWARKLGINSKTLWNRLHRYGWSLERALTEPVQQCKMRV